MGQKGGIRTIVLLDDTNLNLTFLQKLKNYSPSFLYYYNLNICFSSSPHCSLQRLFSMEVMLITVKISITKMYSSTKICKSLLPKYEQMRCFVGGFLFRATTYFVGGFILN